MPHDANDLEHMHTAEAIAARLSQPPKPSYLRDWVLGGIDGAITTFAIVAGVAGAGLSHGIIIILGVANLVADGISMAAGNFSGVKAENDDFRRLREMEQRHVEQTPDGEREEVRQIFQSKGFEGEDLDRAVAIITSDQQRWIDFMLAEEFGAPAVERPAKMSALVTFGAFVICGAVPLIPYLIGAPHSFTIATITTAGVFFAIGSLKSRWSTARWWKSGLETLAIGLVAAAAAYFIGDLLKFVVAP